MKQTPRGRPLAIRELAPALFLGALALLLVLTPLRWPCPLLVVTGLPCPTCGITRATRLALHGDFAAATHMHPLWFVVVPACAALALGEVAAFARARRWGVALEHRWTKRAAGVIVAALVVVWLARFAGALGGPVPRG